MGSSARSTRGSRRCGAATTPEFPAFYAYAQETPDVLFHGSDRAFWAAIATRPVCVGPIAYKPGPVERDIANLRAALEGVDVADAFMPAVAPASAEVDMGNEHYGTPGGAALGARRRAPRGVPGDRRRRLPAPGRRRVDPGALGPRAGPRPRDLPSPTAYARIEALNHALEGLPEERVRYHLCWGSWHGPHATDIPLAEIVDLMLTVNAGTYSVEAANVRHEHEYHLWETVRLPDGKKLAPGVVTHSTNLIEHPELVAERIVRFAERVGRRERDREHRLRHGLAHPSGARLGEARGARRGRAARDAEALRRRGAGVTAVACSPEAEARRSRPTMALRPARFACC